MPIYGKRDLDELLTRATTLDDLHTEPLVLSRVRLLQIAFELEPASAERILPRALSPTIPPWVLFVFWCCEESSLGAFELAEIRIGSRAGIAPRAFPVMSFCDREAAAHELGRRWGFGCRKAPVTVRASYDRVTASVGDWLRISLIDPSPLSPAGLHYVPSMNLALVPRESGLLPRLVQVDAEYAVQRAERGRPRLERFEPESEADRLLVTHPISASYALGDVTLSQIRYLVDPAQPALRATEIVNV